MLKEAYLQLGRHVAWWVPVLSLLLVFVLGRPGQIAAEGSTVAVTATSNAVITATFDGGPVSFVRGSGEGDDGRIPSDGVAVYEAGDSSLGSYHVWKGAGSGLVATVSSNRAWHGSVNVSRAEGRPAWVGIDSGALRFTLAEPRSYADCDNAAALGTTPVEWATNYPKGRARFSFYFCLRVEPGRDLDTVDSPITIQVTQAGGAAVRASPR